MVSAHTVESAQMNFRPTDVPRIHRHTVTLWRSPDRYRFDCSSITAFSLEGDAPPSPFEHVVAFSRCSPPNTRVNLAGKCLRSPTPEARHITPVNLAGECLRSPAPKARHIIAWGASPRITVLSRMRSEGPQDRAGNAALTNRGPSTAAKPTLSHLQRDPILFTLF